MQVLNLLEGQTCDKITAALENDDFDTASEVVENAVLDVETMFGALDEAKTYIESLTLQLANINAARNDFTLARDLETQAMSRASTARNGGASLDPSSRTLSALQRELSAV
jgi:hypothetical protein